MSISTSSSSIVRATASIPISCSPSIASASPRGTRLLFARSKDTTENGGLPTVNGTFSFSLVAVGNIELRVGATTIDRVAWTVATNNTAIQLDPDFTNATDNDDAARYCLASTPYNGVDLGTPGESNLPCVFANQCVDGETVRDKVRPVAGAIVITEVHADPAGTDAVHEWFEIRNLGGDFDLNDLGLKGNGAAIDTIGVGSTACRPLANGAFALFARNADPALNGGLPAVDAVFTFTLANTNGSVSVLDPDGGLLDAVTWTSQPQAGRSRMLLPDQTNATANDDQASFCSTPINAAFDYDGAGPGVEHGTPKALNDDCIIGN